MKARFIQVYTGRQVTKNRNCNRHPDIKEIDNCMYLSNELSSSIFSVLNKSDNICIYWEKNRRLSLLACL